VFVLQTLSRVSGRLGSQTEADQMHSVTVDREGVAQCLDEEGDRVADYSSVGRRLWVEQIAGLTAPIHQKHVCPVRQSSQYHVFQELNEIE
jgi:hypothetical protein